MDNSQVIITIPRAQKGAWVAASRQRGMKLTDWILEKVAMDYDFGGFTLAIPALLPFERYVLALPSDEAADLLRAVRVLDARLMADGKVACDVKIAVTYLEKRVAIDRGIPDHDLFRDINATAMDYYAQVRDLTHSHLIAALLAASANEA